MDACIHTKYKLKISSCIKYVCYIQLYNIKINKSILSVFINLTNYYYIVHTQLDCMHPLYKIVVVLIIHILQQMTSQK